MRIGGHRKSTLTEQCRRSGPPRQRLRSGLANEHARKVLRSHRRPFPERHGVPQHPTELTNHDGIMFHNRSFFWSFEIDGKSVEAMPRTRIEVNTAANCVAAARNGTGIARLFDYQVPGELSSGALVPILNTAAGRDRFTSSIHANVCLLSKCVPSSIGSCPDFARYAATMAMRRHRNDARTS